MIALLDSVAAAVRARPSRPATSDSIGELVTRSLTRCSPTVSAARWCCSWPTRTAVSSSARARTAIAARRRPLPRRSRSPCRLGPRSRRQRARLGRGRSRRPEVAWHEIAPGADPAALGLLEDVGPCGCVHGAGASAHRSRWARLVVGAHRPTKSPGGLRRAPCSRTWPTRSGSAGAYQDQVAATLERREAPAAPMPPARRRSPTSGAGRSSGSPTPTSSRTPSACSPNSWKSTSCTCSRP